MHVVGWAFFFESEDEGVTLCVHTIGVLLRRGPRGARGAGRARGRCLLGRGHARLPRRAVRGECRGPQEVRHLLGAFHHLP